MPGMWFNEEKPPMTDESIQDLIKQNAKVPFVNRLINRHLFPTRNNPDGSFSTHLMSWSSIGDGKDRKYIAYPLLEMIDGKLADLSKAPYDPVRMALSMKNYIAFDKPEEAKYFTENYKKALGIE